METKKGEGIRYVRSSSPLTKEALSRVRRDPTRHYHRGTPWRKTSKNRS